MANPLGGMAGGGYFWGSERDAGSVGSMHVEGLIRRCRFGQLEGQVCV